MTDRRPRILLYGKDGRTDAIAECLLQSATPCELSICAPFRNPGLFEKADRFVTATLTDLGAMVAFAREVRPDLVVIGPEDPLSVGLVDALVAIGLPCFGPTRALARVETSKSWARALVERHGIEGNPRHRTFSAAGGTADPIARELAAYAGELGDVVVKPDGLTGGKGVKVQGEQLGSLEDAVAYALSLLASDGSVVIEERLEGEELSLQTITDGEAVVHCPIAQDHKRAYEGDIGPNTGGMGSYSCPDHSLPFLHEDDVATACRVNEDIVQALGREVGEPYRGVLYGGFMAVAGGVRLIECNARFGDPEAMNVLPLLEQDLFELLFATAMGRLGALRTSFAPRATVCKYVVPMAYPEGVAGRSVLSTDESVLGHDLRRYWAAAELAEDSSMVLAGSRGLAFVGLGDTMAEAEVLAERGASSVGGAVRHRRDIGTNEALVRRVEHMRRIRPSAPSSHG